MRSLRHYYRKHVRRHGRFHLAVLLTIVAVPYLLVPWVVSLLDGAARGYGPGPSDAKDASRQDWIARHHLAVSPSPSWRTALNVLLVFAVVIAWMRVLPWR